jgi:hypothetical protein
MRPIRKKLYSVEAEMIIIQVYQVSQAELTFHSVQLDYAVCIAYPR